MNFSRGVGGSLSHLWKFRRGGGGGISPLQKWKIQGGGGVLSEIPSMVGVWIFSGTTHWNLEVLFLTQPSLLAPWCQGHDQESSKERWLSSLTRQEEKPVKYPDKNLSGYGRVPTINST